MVLSNKKFKKKLRHLVAESQSQAASEGAGKGVNEELQRIKEILRNNSKKRPKRKRPPKAQEKDPFAAEEEKLEEKDGRSQSADVKEQNKSKKRKRDGGAAAVPVDGKETRSEGKKRKERKKPRWKKGEESIKSGGEGQGSSIAADNEKGTAKPNNVEQRYDCPTVGKKFDSS